MKKTLITATSLVLMMLISATAVLGATIGLGSATIDRVNTDTWSDFVIVDTNNPASILGEITEFQYFAKNTNPFKLMVVSSANKVIYKSDLITPTTTGLDTYAPASAIVVHPGDNLAMYFQSTGTIPFDYTGDPALYTNNQSGDPAVGDTLSYVGQSNRVYSVAASGTQLPYGIILTPSENEIVYGTYNFTAQYNDGDAINDDTVNWAIRKDVCTAATNTVFGNVDGHNDPYTWDGSDFLASIDTSSAEPGHYCFVFNPTDDPGQTDVRETVEFELVEAPIGPPTNKDECKSDGWMTFTNPPFKNQGDCVSYVQSSPNAIGNKDK